MEAFLLRQDLRLPGTGSLPAEEVNLAGISEADSRGWFRDFARGLALYGIPLTDPLPRQEEGVYRQAQRFSRGWMIRQDP